MPSYRRSKGIQPEFQKQPGERVNRYVGTFIGYIKDNRDVQKNGRLKVWIPDLGGDPEDTKAWIIASYASPFAGATPVKFNDKDLQEYNNSQSSYGFWMVPPDVDNQVLVTFANGDSTRCFWFGCVYNNYMNQEVPGIAASDSENHYGPETTTDDCPLPTGEYNKYSKERRTVVPDDEPKPVQPYVAEGLKNQGLIYDEIRGTTDSSARRESPSKVFGISTPGPHATEEEGGRKGHPYNGRDPEYSNPETLITRKGGHQIIFDDHEDHEHIKLRTRSGAEILLDETNGIVYFANRDGTSWVELSESGHFDFYSKKSMSARTEKDFNLRADRDINFEAGRNINIKSAKDYLEDPAAFLKGYADSQQETLVDTFDEKVQKEFVKDFPEIDKDIKSGKLTLKQGFKKALKQQGFPTTGSPANTFTSGQDGPSMSTLTAVQQLALLRGSHIIGEGFGDSGNINIQSLGDMNLHSMQDSAWTAEDGSMNIFSGFEINQTSGKTINYLAGTGITATAGTSIGIMSGLDMKIHSGGDFDLGVMNHSRVHFRGDVIALLEGEKLDIEAQPVWLQDNGREVFQDRPHITRIKLQDFNFEAERVRATIQPWEGSATFPTMSTFELTVGTELEPGLMTVNVPGGNIDFAGGTFDVQAGSGGITGPIVGNATIVSGTTPPTAIVPATKAEVADYYPESGPVPPEGLPWSIRPGSAKTASLADIPMIYSKINVLPLLKREGNKEYCITYHTQTLETTARRFLTHEPCVEHENTGKAEEKNDDFAENLRFRIID